MLKINTARPKTGSFMLSIINCLIQCFIYVKIVIVLEAVVGNSIPIMYCDYNDIFLMVENLAKLRILCIGNISI